MQPVFTAEQMRRLDVRAIAELGIGRKFQKPTIFRNHTVFENLEVALKTDKRVLPTLRAQRTPEQDARIDEVLGQVGMADHAAARIGALSTGQQQRVLIARALVSKPELLILDEPTGGVDPEAQTSFYALLHHLNRERDVTLILVSHDIGVVAKEVTKLACLNRRLIFHGRPGDFLSDAALTALYGPAVRVVSHDH